MTDNFLEKDKSNIEIEFEDLLREDNKEKLEEKKSSIPITKILLQFSDKWDILEICIAAISSFTFGFTILMKGFILANSINHLHRDKELDDYLLVMIRDIYMYIALALGMFLSGFAHCYLWNKSGTKLSLKYKEEYFKLVLQQDQVWFDNQNVHELSSKVDSQTRAIESGVK